MQVTIAGARYEFEDVVIRTPLLPFATVEGLATSPEAAGTLLRQYANDAIISEGLYLASADLVGSLARGEWEGRPLSAVFRYVTRAASRSTPFGIFAGCSVGTVGGSRTAITLAPRRDYERHTRLDNSVTAALERSVFSLRSTFQVFANTSLFLHRGYWRWVARRPVVDIVSFDIVQTVATPETDRIVSLAMTPMAFDELVERAAGELGRPAEEISEFVRDMLDAQLLVADATLAGTGPNPLDELIERCGHDESSRAIQSALQATADDLKGLDRRLGNAGDDYEKAVGRLRPLITDAQIRFQVDLFKPAEEAVLGDGVAATIAAAADLLVNIAPERDENYVMRLRDVFLRRYGSAEVPLLEALDEELGIDIDPGADIGPGGLLDGIVFPPYEESLPPTSRERTELLFKFIERAQHAGDIEVKLTADDVASLHVDQLRPAPSSLSIIGALAADRADSVERGNYTFVVRGVGGPPGVRLLGRFCDGSGEILRIARKEAENEQRWYGDDIILAEVVHVPYGRTANLSHRPVLRDYEIPYLARSGAPPSRQIHPSDIFLSVRDGNFQFRSASLQRQIIPRVTTAQNFFTGMRLNRFLAATQAERSVSWMEWNWGVLMGAPFLPRLRFGRVVFSRARWNFSRELLTEALKDVDGGQVQAFREKYRVPRYVTIGEDDEELMLDLENPLAVQELLRFAGKRSVTKVTEAYPRPDEHLFVKSEEGTFLHELIAPMWRAGTREPVPTFPAEQAAMRRHLPGDSWAYAKLYGTPSVADQLILRARRDLIEPLLASGAIDQWFFIRFNDPDWHLRIRVHLAGDSWDAVTKAFRDVFRDDCEAGTVWKFEWSTYEREIERYGGSEALPLVEKLFMFNSEAAVDIQEQIHSAGRSDDRWLAALLGVDSIFDQANLDLQHRYDLMKTYGAAMATEIALNAADIQHIARRFRRDRKQIQALLARNHDDALMHQIQATLDEHGRRAAGTWSMLRELTGLPDSLVRSVVHMHMNRALPSAHRRHERVVYDYLWRTYEARLSMEKRRSGDERSFQRVDR